MDNRRCSDSRRGVVSTGTPSDAMEKFGGSDRQLRLLLILERQSSLRDRGDSPPIPFKSSPQRYTIRLRRKCRERKGTSVSTGSFRGLAGTIWGRSLGRDLPRGQLADHISTTDSDRTARWAVATACGDERVAFDGDSFGDPNYKGLQGATASPTWIEGG